MKTKINQEWFDHFGDRVKIISEPDSDGFIEANPWMEGAKQYDTSIVLVVHEEDLHVKVRG